MSKCSRIRRKKQQVCVGDLNTEIILQDRAIAEPEFGSVDFDETFTPTATVWAAVNTVEGKNFFDGVATDTPITHNIFIRYDETVTAETWIELGGRRIDILRVDNLDERSQFMKLICTERGSTSAEASKA